MAADRGTGRSAAQHDAAVPETPDLGVLFVLIQVLPTVEVLATCHDRERLVEEALQMAAINRERGGKVLYRWFVRQAAMHLA